MKRRTASWSLRPGARSTPLATSTPHGCTALIVAATFSGVNPPASSIRSKRCATAAAASQSALCPVPPYARGS